MSSSGNSTIHPNELSLQTLEDYSFSYHEERIMPKFILLTKLSPDSLRDLAKIEENSRAWKKEVEERCPEVRFHEHFWALGPYDFISIYDAPNEKVASKVSLISMSLGAQNTETWTLLPYSEYIKEVHELLGP